MKPYYSEPNIAIYNNDCIEVMKEIDDNSIDAIVTDPPYELGFMGKHWDRTGIAYNIEAWQQALRILKPGGYLLSFGGTRTYHRMACAIEDAGFEIRDMIEWIYGSGFPKSHNIGKAIDKLQGNDKEIVGVDKNPTRFKEYKEQDGCSRKTFNDKITKGNSEWEGWGTALKPAHEPVCMARKPLSEKTVAKNVLKWGIGGINIDECRVGTGAKKWSEPKGGIFHPSENNNAKLEDNPKGRFPANLIHDGSDEVVALFPDSKGQQGDVKGTEPSHTGQNGIYSDFVRVPATPKRNDSGSAARFFYCAKASKAERNKGLEGLENKQIRRLSGGQYQDNSGSLNSNKNGAFSKNNHPTVKPLKLMQYLIKLVTTENAIVLDPFMGSGTTLKACKDLGRKCIGIEINEEYVKIAIKRLGQEVLF